MTLSTSQVIVTWSMLGLAGNSTVTRVFLGLQSGSWLQTASLQVRLVMLDWEEEEGREREERREVWVSRRAYVVSPITAIAINITNYRGLSLITLNTGLEPGLLNHIISMR